MVDSTILGPDGQPVRRGDLEELQSQTARVGHLPQEYAEHPSKGLTPTKLRSVLERAEAGDLSAQADLGEDMEELDGHVLAEMGKRKRALLTVSWDLQPPRNATQAERKATDQARELLAAVPDLEDVILDALDAIGKGYSCQEIEWAMQGRDWLPQAIHYRPPRWFTVPAQGRSEEIRLRDGSADGEPLQPAGWIVHKHKAKSGHVARGGLHRILAWPFLFKTFSARDLAEFLEIYGLPLRLGTYPPGASDAEKSTLLKAVVNIGHNAAGIIPKGMGIDFKEAAEGRSDPYMAMIDWAERTESKAILGQTLTAQADRGSNTNALGSIHNEVRQDLRDSDARQLGQTLTRDLVWPIVAFNVRGITDPNRAPRFVFDTREPEDIERYAKALPPLVRIGARIPTSYVHEQLGIPEPGEEEEVLQFQGGQRPGAAAARAQPGGHPQGCQCAGCLRVAAGATASGPGDTPEAQAARLGEEAEPAIEGMLEQIRELIDQVETMEELAERLLDAYPELDESDLAEVMGQAFTAASLAGRYDLTEG